MIDGPDVMEVFYDLALSPVTFDFTHFLANAEKRRLESGAESLRVSFVNGERAVSHRDFDFTPERKAWRLHNVLVPMCRTLPSCVGYSIVDEGKQDISYRPLNKFKCLSPTSEAQSLIVDHLRTNKPVVTITLRQSDFQISRNSNVEELKKLAEWLSKDFLVVFVPDTEAYLTGKHTVTGFRECYPAALNMDMRLALYEHAKLNIFTSGGPFGLAMYGASSLLLCKTVVPSIPSCTEEMQRKLGYGPEDKLVNEYQRISWTDDSFDALKPVVEEHLAVCMKREREIKKLAVFTVLGERRLDNMRDAVKRGFPQLVQEFTQERSMAIVCYGPSLQKMWHRLKGGREDIFTVSGAHDFLIERGIVPKGHIEADPRPHKAFFTKTPHKDVAYYIASCCDESVFDNLQGFDVRLWHSWDSPEFEQAVLEVERDPMLIGGGSNAGLRAIAVGTVLGYKKFSIYGMDCSFTDEQHAGVHSGKKQRVMDVRCGDRIFKSSPQMVSSCNEFMELLVHLNGSGCEFMVHGDGLLQHRLHLENIAAQRRAA